MSGHGLTVLAPTTFEQVLAAEAVFDARPDRAATDRFLAAPDHHLLFALDADGAALGFVSGVETTHPDKGTEMFLYELGVAEAARGRGVATALVTALRELAAERGCYGMWVLTDADNAAANATYRKTGGGDVQTPVMYSWDLTAHAGEQRTDGTR